MYIYTKTKTTFLSSKFLKKFVPFFLMVVDFFKKKNKSPFISKVFKIGTKGQSTPLKIIRFRLKDIYM